MFGNSSSTTGHNPTLMPATSMSPASASSLFHLPAFVSQSADPSPSSAVLLPASVIVPPQTPQQFLHQLGPSPSTISSAEATTPIFGANPLMNNLIASLATLSRPHPIIPHSSSSHQNVFPLITDVFQNSLAECLRHSSSTPNVKNDLPFRNAMDNANNGSTATALPNGTLLNASLPTDHLHFAHYSPIAPKAHSSVELLQRALEAFAVANQSKIANSSAIPAAQSAAGSPLVPPPHANNQSHGTTTAATMSNVEQQLLSLLSFTQLNSTNNNSNKNDTNLDHHFHPFAHQSVLSVANGICQHSFSTSAPTTTAATTAPTTAASDATAQNEGVEGVEQPAGDQRGAASAAADDPSVPIDLSQSLLLSPGTNLAIPRGRKSCDIRRSASSVSYKGSADVHEHFQRTFSGKWPRRQPSLRSHLQLSGARAAVGKKEAAATALSITETGGGGTARTEEPMEEEEEAEEGGASSGGARGDGTDKARAGGKTPEEGAAQPAHKGRPKSRQQVKSVYTAVIRKLFTSNEVKQVEDHFRKSLGEDRFLQIKNEQQRRQREGQAEGEDEDGQKMGEGGGGHPSVDIVRL